MNDTGAFLWEQLQSGEQTEEKLTEALFGEYEVDRESASKDVEEFLRILQEHGILSK